jgi:Domain of Unknown Function with PDB structure (DUF3857)/Protein of unknown function (DUF2569)
LIVLLRFCFHISLLILILLLGSVRCVRAENTAVEGKRISFDVAPVPPWVKPVEPGSALDVGAENAGMVYLLADRQENLQRNAFFYREVRKIVSQKGLESGASIVARFNPTFERLVFNSIKVIRNGTISDRLDRSRIDIVPREKEPQRSIYDPSLSARMVLDDVRVGDLIELAFTIEGANPLNRGKYSKTYLIQWEALIVRNVLRLIYSADRKLVFKAENGAREPTITTANGINELWYEDRNIPGRTIEEENVPDYYEPRQLLEVSEFQSWGEVAQWAMPLFKTEPPHSREFDTEIEKLRAVIDPEERVVAATQFVQNEIQYVKLGMWLAARPLTSPEEILRHRFANHLDKGLLLVTLLRAVQMDATPALVSGSYREAIRAFLPSADIVDHVLVQVRLGQKTYWINPAATDQRGPLSQMYVLRPGSAELTPVEQPPGSFPVTKVIENYSIPPPDKIPELEVISEYRGLAADRTRAFFRETTREEIQKRYLEYYTRAFPDAKAQRAPWYEELPGENACRVTESYIVPRLWQLNEEKNRYTLSLQPLEMYSALGSTISPQRHDPLRLEYPSTVIEELNVQMFEDWPLNAEGASINNEFFRVRDEPTASGSSLQFHFFYEAVKDRVEVAEFEKFNEQISKAKDTLGYTLRYQTPEQIKKTKERAAFNWAVGAAALCFLATAIFLAYGYFRQSKLAQPIPPPIDVPARLNGIRGWLVLLAVGQVLLPLRFTKPIYDVFSAAMDTSSWRSLTDPIESSYNAWWAPALLFELFFNLGAFVFAALLVVLFFAKRAAWRSAFAAFLIFTLLGAVIDTVLVDHIPSAAEPVLTSVADLAPIVLAAAIWIPYVWFSKRARATFRY